MEFDDLEGRIFERLALLVLPVGDALVAVGAVVSLVGLPGERLRPITGEPVRLTRVGDAAQEDRVRDAPGDAVVQLGLELAVVPQPFPRSTLV